MQTYEIINVCLKCFIFSLKNPIILINMRYRFSKQRPEIVKNLEKNLKGGCSVLVWQKNIDGTRSFVQNMTFCSLFPEEGVFTLKETTEYAGPLDLNKDVYFYMEEENFIFKTKMAVVQKDIMTLQIPREIRLKEFRIHDRTYFSLDEKKSVLVIFPIKEQMNAINVSCPLINISESGACILVSKETFSKIDFSIDLTLKLTTDFQRAVIRNARLFIKKTLSHEELYAIGIEFQ